MQKIKADMRIIRVVSFLLDVIMLVYFALFCLFFYDVLDIYDHPLTMLFIRIDPFTTGLYCMGAAMILHLIAFRNLAGRCVICISYILSAVLSLIALMGVTDWSELLMYVPHIFIIGASIGIIVWQIKTGRKPM